MMEASARRHQRHFGTDQGLRAGRDRWLVSYADLVTLLFACFATAYAAASTPAPAPSPPPSPVTSSESVERAPAAVRPSVRDLIEPIVLAALGSSHLELVEDRRGLVITLPESATFDPASITLTEDAMVFLDTLAAALGPTTANLRIEGHTDDVPIGSGRFETNWELSTARASAVVLYLINDAGFPPARLSAAGYGEFKPRVTNDSPERRALNRRVDVVVVSDEPAAMEVAATVATLPEVEQ